MKYISRILLLALLLGFPGSSHAIGPAVVVVPSVGQMILNVGGNVAAFCLRDMVRLRQASGCTLALMLAYEEASGMAGALMAAGGGVISFGRAVAHNISTLEAEPNEGRCLNTVNALRRAYPSCTRIRREVSAARRMQQTNVDEARTLLERISSQIGNTRASLRGIHRAVEGAGAYCANQQDLETLNQARRSLDTCLEQADSDLSQLIR